MTADRIRSLWASFNKAFWAIFVIKLISEQSLKSLNYPDDLAIAFIVLGALNLAMAIVMGLYAYRLSGRRKIFLVLGLLGFIWIGGFGVFIGYFVLRNIKRNAEIRLENSSDNPKVPENSPQMRVSVNDLAASTYRKAGSISKIDAVKNGYRHVNKHDISSSELSDLSDKELKRYYEAGLRNSDRDTHPKAGPAEMRRRKLAPFFRKYWGVITLTVLLLLTLYLMTIRPTSIKQKCDGIARKYATDKGYNIKESYEFSYTACLHKNGI
jgi:hypothetical protein